MGRRRRHSGREWTTGYYPVGAPVRAPERVRWQTGRTRLSWKGRLIACVPWITVLLLLSAVAYREMFREARLWEEISQIWTQGDVSRLDRLDEYLRRYPNGAFAETVAFFRVQLAAQTQDCTQLRPEWERLLDAQNPEHRIRAALALADCAFQEGDLETAQSYYQRVVQENPNSPEAVVATLQLGQIAEQRDDPAGAAEAYRRVWEMAAATPEQVAGAARRLGALYQGRVRPGWERYTVRRGDYLGRIARRFGVSLDALLAANPQLEDPSRLQVGQEIQLPISRFSAQVDLEAGALYLLYQGNAIRVYPVAVGDLEHPVPTGRYQTGRPILDPEALRELLRRRPELRAIGVGAGWIPLNPDRTAVHGGAPVEVLRQPVTPGTIQMLDEDLLELARWLPENATVQIVSTAPSIRWAPLP